MPAFSSPAGFRGQQSSLTEHRQAARWCISGAAAHVGLTLCRGPHCGVALAMSWLQTFPASSPRRGLPDFLWGTYYDLVCKFPFATTPPQLHEAVNHGDSTPHPGHLRQMISGRGVQPMAHRPHAAQDGFECGPTQNHKFT